MNLRPYQQQAHDAAIEWVKNTADPCVLELPTGSGKSLIVAAIANTLHNISKGKHVLCIVPSKELLEQNAEKYEAIGNPCSLFSASVGETCLKYPVVFGTPISIKNKIHKVIGLFGRVTNKSAGVTAKRKSYYKMVIGALFAGFLVV